MNINIFFRKLNSCPTGKTRKVLISKILCTLSLNFSFVHFHFHQKKYLTLEILASQASASTITKEGDSTNPNLLTTRPKGTHSTNVLAIKLSH